jgi:HlyD family secretion protein
MKRSRLALGFAVGLIAAATGLYFAVRLLPARSAANHGLLLSGNIEAHESVVAFKSVQSRIVELPFDEGQWVEAGTLLARLDASDYQQQVAIDKAALRMRRAALASAEQGFEAARDTVLADVADQAQRTLDLAQVAQWFGDSVPPAPRRFTQAGGMKISILDLARMATFLSQPVTSCP